MKYICNRCAKVFQDYDITIHYTTDDNCFNKTGILGRLLRKNGLF